MANPKVIAGNLQWLGLAPETTYGTAAAAPTVWVPVSSPKFTPKIQTMVDDAMRGSMAKSFGLQQGLRYDEVSYSSHVYSDSVFPHLVAMLGQADTITGAADPYTHKTSLLNGLGGTTQPTSHTVFYADGSGQAWAIPGAQMSNLKFSIKTDGLVGMDASWVGLPAVPITAPTNSPSTLPPVPGWNSSISIGGVNLSKFSSIEIDLKRVSEMVPTITATQSPFAIFAGEVDPSVSLTGVYQGGSNGASDTDFAAFLANSQPSLIVALGNANDAAHRLTLQMSKVAFNDSSFSGGNKWLEVQSKAMPLANATDALGGGLSPLLATLTSTASTAFA